MRATLGGRAKLSSNCRILAKDDPRGNVMDTGQTALLDEQDRIARSEGSAPPPYGGIADGPKSSGSDSIGDHGPAEVGDDSTSPAGSRLVLSVRQAAPRQIRSEQEPTTNIRLIPLVDLHSGMLHPRRTDNDEIQGLVNRSGSTACCNRSWCDRGRTSQADMRSFAASVAGEQP